MVFDRIRRRSYIGAAVGGAVALAGCFSDGADGDDADDGSELRAPNDEEVSTALQAPTDGVSVPSPTER